MTQTEDIFLRTRYKTNLSGVFNAVKDVCEGTAQHLMAADTGNLVDIH